MFHTEGKTGPACHTGTDGTVTLEPCPGPQGLPELMSLAERVCETSAKLYERRQVPWDRPKDPRRKN